MSFCLSVCVLAGDYWEGREGGLVKMGLVEDSGNGRGRGRVVSAVLSCLLSYGLH